MKSIDKKRHPRDFDRAMKGYRSFQQLEPREIGLLRGLVIPRQMTCIGEGVHILYRSDKWEDKENNYIHEHEGGLKYYVPRGKGHEVRTPSFLMESDITLYRLGHCQGWAFKDPQDHEEIVDVTIHRPYPQLYSIASGKALLVVDDTGSSCRLVCAAWGGKLDVLDVGIVG